MSGTKAGAAKRSQTRPDPSVITEGPAEVIPDHPVYLVPPKRALMHQGVRLEAGDVIPGAHSWPRIESWLNTGRIVKQA